MFDTLIKNGKIVTAEEIYQANIAIKDGKIAAILAEDIAVEADTEIDAEGNFVFPGFIDTHAHLNDPGYEWRENYSCGTAAAAAGGYTTIIDMPVQNEPAVVNGAAADAKIAAAKEKAYVDFALWGGLIPENFDCLQEMEERGCVAFKSFVSPTAPGFSPLNYGQAYEAMQVLKQFGGKAGFHCEDFSTIVHCEKVLKQAGKTDWNAFLDSRPVVAELIATTAIIELAKATGCKVHICHVSSPDVAQKIKEAQQEGYDITAETCPHYLSMSREEVIANGALFKCAPPLRSRAEVERLWDYVADGTFSGIGSDHSPSTYEEKFVEIDGKKIENAFDPWGGMSGLQTAVQTVFSEGCVKRNLSPTFMADVMAKKAAKAFGIYGQKGDIQIGFDADFVFIDPHQDWQCKAEELYYLNKMSAFVGKSGRGAVVKTILRGNVVAENGKIVGRSGYGQMVKKQK